MEGNFLTSILRLTRPVNLLIIGATMLGVYTKIITANPLLKLDFFDFVFFTIGTLLVASGGNVINDYYDIKADKINKPKQLIISNILSKKQALFFYMGLNLSSILIGLYLSIEHNSFWFLFLNSSCILALWFYSRTLKKKLIIGNILIALLTGLIPLLALSYFYFTKATEIYSIHGTTNLYFIKTLSFIIYLSIFASLQNLAREIWKDAEDIEGDEKINVISIPIQYGIQNAKRIVAFILITELLLYLMFFKELKMELNPNSFLVFNLALSMNLIILVSISKHRLFMKYGGTLLKISMVIGLSSLYL